MQFSFSKEWPEQLGTTRLGIISGNVRCGEATEKLTGQVELLAESIKKRYQLSEINSQPVIAETRAAYKIVGNDPNRYRPSADSLLRRIVKGNGLYAINSVVDALNYVSVSTGFSIGGYDRIKITGNLQLGVGEADEPYEGIGRGSLNISKLPVLRDNVGAFGSPTSDSIRTCISGQTNSILIVFFDFGRNSTLEAAMQLMKSMLFQYSNAGELILQIKDFK